MMSIVVLVVGCIISRLLSLIDDKKINPFLNGNLNILFLLYSEF